jgi:WD40 repeat protein
MRKRISAWTRRVLVVGWGFDSRPVALSFTPRCRLVTRRVEEVLRVSISFSPDGRYLATVSSDGTATKWDSATGEEIVVYHGPGGPLEHVKITPDGKKMIIAGTDYIYGFIFDLNETIRLARSRLTLWFMLEECRKYLHQEECPPTP